RALTGKDVAPTTDAWVRLYPHANVQAEGIRLSANLLKASPDQRDQLLVKYRDSKEEHYTEGLANAIPHLPSKLQSNAPEALGDRLARLPVDPLRACLEDGDDELRLAACLACIRKADKELVPELIGLLSDSNREVTEGAKRMLQRLTGQNFGPSADASREER